MATYPTTGSTPWGPNLKTYIDAGDAAAAAPFVKPAGAVGTFDLGTGTRTHATFQIITHGIDTVAGAVYGLDTTNGVLRISEDWGTTWSNSKGIPTNTTLGNIECIVRFGNYIWCVTKDNTSNAYGVYRATPQTGNTALTWSSALFTFTSGTAGGVKTMLAAGTSYLFASEYGDPVGGPTLWRISLTDANGAGTNFVSCFTDATLRHIHAVAEDPYNAGQIWMTTGDGVGAKAIQKSTNNGTSWTAVGTSGGWQAVAISFSPQYVWFASDQNRGTVFVMDRTALVPQWASTTWHHNIAVPNGGWRKGGYVFTDYATTSGSSTVTSATAAFTSRDNNRRIAGAGVPPNSVMLYVNATTITLATATPGISTTAVNATATATGVTLQLETERFYSNAYFGRVDPATGIYYSGTTTGSQYGQTHGMFYLPAVGQAMQVLDQPPEGTPAGSQFAGMGQVYIANGLVFWERYIRPLQAPTALLPFH